MTSSLRGVRVIVAGAGLAGLTAAREFSNRGATVRTFEARDRIGGRVWTSRGSPLAPHHGELGGELIDGDHHAIRALRRIFTPHADALAGVDDDWSSSVAAAIGRRSMADGLASARASALTRAHATSLRNFWMADPDALSALVAAELAGRAIQARPPCFTWLEAMTNWWRR